MADKASFGAAVFVACIRTGNTLVTVMASLGLFALFINGVLALDVIMFVGKPSNATTRGKLFNVMNGVGVVEVAGIPDMTRARWETKNVEGTVTDASSWSYNCEVEG
jgi:hypothetical protein